jgi:hypothetical protein
MFLHLMKKRTEQLKKAVSILPLFLILAFVLLKFAAPGLVSRYLPSFDLYRWLVREDGPIENCEFVAAAVSFFLAVSISIHLFRTDRKVYAVLYALLGLALFYVAGEEISWGQRIFQIHTPTYFLQHNYQKEMNTHNLRGTWRYIHAAYILAGLYGAFGRFMLPRWFRDRRLFAADSYLMLYFIPVSVIYFYFDFITPIEVKFFGNHFIYHRFVYDFDQEPAEFLLMMGFLFFTAINKYRQTTVED